MPLHLLGKKSWNVYNQDNIERVRRDEEKARNAQKEEERRIRDNDAVDRLRLLRGDQDDSEVALVAHPGHKRKRDQEDDQDDRGPKLRDSRPGDGHDWRSRNRSRSPNTTTDPLDRISNMRFRDAAGRNTQTPWYSTPKPDVSNGPATVGRDVWGNEDAGRQVRDQKRMDASDPLLAIKRGVKQLRDVEKQKVEWRREREKDLNEVEDIARKARRRARARDGDQDRDRRGDRETHGEKRERHKERRHGREREH